MPQVAVSVLELTLSFGIKRQSLGLYRCGELCGLRAIQPWQNSIASAIHDRLINIVFLIQPKRGYAFRADGYYEARSASTFRDIRANLHSQHFPLLIASLSYLAVLEGFLVFCLPLSPAHTDS
ncbi:hypothetical protein FIBSPDRAFT_944005 [Athelia psychrophila]|uniref:Uncharacterized protein n=1 Tax=Athelia psychrophila TaxID=1759441 RepID=A0A166VTA1_9AGAM|nr:hypothetical protein FIBSPDRAFT_944005 [Fibularhizoctonia sp. CBS 109695]